MYRNSSFCGLSDRIFLPPGVILYGKDLLRLNMYQWHTGMLKRVHFFVIIKRSWCMFISATLV